MTKPSDFYTKCKADTDVIIYETMPPVIVQQEQEQGMSSIKEYEEYTPELPASELDYLPNELELEDDFSLFEDRVEYCKLIMEDNGIPFKLVRGEPEYCYQFEVECNNPLELLDGFVRSSGRMAGVITLHWMSKHVNGQLIIAAKGSDNPAGCHLLWNCEKSYLIFVNDAVNEEELLNCLS